MSFLVLQDYSFSLILPSFISLQQSFNIQSLLLVQPSTPVYCNKYLTCYSCFISVLFWIPKAFNDGEHAWVASVEICLCLFVHNMQYKPKPEKLDHSPLSSSLSPPLLSLHRAAVCVCWYWFLMLSVSISGPGGRRPVCLKCVCLCMGVYQILIKHCSSLHHA